MTRTKVGSEEIVLPYMLSLGDQELVVRPLQAVTITGRSMFEPTEYQYREAKPADHHQLYTRNLTMKNTIAFLLLIWIGINDQTFASDKPNILIVYADDLGYGDVQCYNPERGKIHTPNIDKLASQGMRFTDAHSSSGVCSPSRYTLLTGRYHWRTRLQSGIVGVFGDPLIAANRMTIGTLAQQHGFRTACIGKWHLGSEWNLPKGKEKLFRDLKGVVVATDEHRDVWAKVFSQPVGGGPTTRGFNYYFGTDVPNWPPFCFIENDRTIGVPCTLIPQKLLETNQASVQGPSLENWTLEPILPSLVDRANAFISQTTKDLQPFLLYLPLTSPHTPLAVNEEWKGKSGLNLYADFVMETDAAVGRVLDTLEQCGVVENTLVLFTADNGCAPYIGIPELEKMGHYPSGPLRGAKADAWEGGHRVPFIVRWPGKVKPGSCCDQLVHQADVLATLAEILGNKLHDHEGEDSFSMLSLLRGSDNPVREHSVSTSVQGIPAVRNGSWKYIPAPGSGGWGKGGDISNPVQLYDLATDIGETKNLALSVPNKIPEMQSLLERLITEGRSRPGALQQNDVEVRRYPALAAKDKQD
jgi:arylsulfatase A